MPLNCAKRLAGSIALLALSLAPAFTATNDAANLCLRAASAAAEKSGVPFDVLLAIAVVESGRGGRPWPWTVNLGGDGHWLTSAEEAATLAAQALDAGRTNIDLGCFQLNYHWHEAGFDTVADMLDPERNAIYAADLLASLFDRTGDWAAAAAAYHSATPEYAKRYRARFEAVLAAQEHRAEWPVLQPELPIVDDRENGFPLLVAGPTGSRGSLVPATTGGLRLIGGS